MNLIERLKWALSRVDTRPDIRVEEYGGSPLTILKEVGQATLDAETAHLRRRVGTTGEMLDLLRAGMDELREHRREVLVRGSHIRSREEEVNTAQKSFDLMNKVIDLAQDYLYCVRNPDVPIAMAEPEYR